MSTCSLTHAQFNQTSTSSYGSAFGPDTHDFTFESLNPFAGLDDLPLLVEDDNLSFDNPLLVLEALSIGQHTEALLAYFKERGVLLPLEEPDFHLAIAQHLHKSGVDLSVPHPTVGSFLHLAAATGNFPLAEYLVKTAKLSPDGPSSEDPFSATPPPLYVATSNHHIHIVQFLVKAGASVFIFHPDHGSLLSAAVRADCPTLVHYYLSKGIPLIGFQVTLVTNKVPIPIRESPGALELAFFLGRMDCIDILADFLRSPLSPSSILAVSLLYFAARGGHAHLVKALLDSGVSPVSTNLGSLPLHAAVLYGHIEVARVLLPYKALIHLQDAFGETPLHYAVFKGDIEMATLLLMNGANPLAGNKKSISPLKIATRRGYKDMVEIFLSYLNRPDDQGVTIHYCALLAAKEGPLDLLTYLIEKYNLNLNLKDDNSRTFLHCAAMGSQPTVVQYFLSAGVLPSCRDRQGSTPSMLAINPLLRFCKDELKVELSTCCHLSYNQMEKAKKANWSRIDRFFEVIELLESHTKTFSYDLMNLYQKLLTLRKAGKNPPPCLSSTFLSPLPVAPSCSVRLPSQAHCSSSSSSSPASRSFIPSPIIYDSRFNTATPASSPSSSILASGSYRLLAPKPSACTSFSFSSLSGPSQ